MDNVHSLHDTEAGRSNSAPAPDSTLKYFKDILCPKFSIRSVTMLLILINIGVFLVLSLAALATPIKYECLLYIVGALYPPDLRSFQIHRLLVPVFLHFDVWHLLTNVVSALFLSFEPEDSLGLKRFLILYFGSSVYGFLLSCVALPVYLTAGASAAIMGLMGYFLVRVFFGLRNMDNRSYGIFIALMLLNLMFVFTSQSGNVYAHAGGMLFGGLFTLYISDVPVLDYPNIEKWKKWAKVVIIAYPVIVVLAFLVIPARGGPIC